MTPLERIAEAFGYAAAGLIAYMVLGATLAPHLLDILNPYAPILQVLK